MKTGLSKTLHLERGRSWGGRLGEVGKGREEQWTRGREDGREKREKLGQKASETFNNIITQTGTHCGAP